MIKGWVYRLAVWWIKRFGPELITHTSRELEGLYNPHLEKYLYTTTLPMKNGGPLGWSTEPFGFTDDGIDALHKHPTLQMHVDTGLMKVPLTVNISKVKTSLITSEEFERSVMPDFVNAVKFIP